MPSPRPRRPARVVAAAALGTVVLLGLGRLALGPSTPFIPPPTEEAPAAPSGPSSAAARATAVAPRPLCPETVRKLPNLSGPRNAAGHIRYCWPTEAHCYCDADDDCYRLEGYVPCAPRPASVPDAGTPVRPDAGPAPRDAGPVVRDAGPAPRDAGPAVRDAGVVVIPPIAPDAGRPPPPPPNPAGLRAFPGAEGFGASATGGRGGRVIYVTTLATSGPGSFQDAVGQTGPRYVLFKVSGLIDGDVQIRHGDLTVAGQTSPGGITVRGLHTTEEPYCDQQCGPSARGVENFILRHLRSRPAGGSFPDGLRLRYARNGVMDHLSMGNASDEAVEISYSNTLTVQDCLLAETLGEHAPYGGMLINYTNPAAGYALDGLTILRTVWNRIQGRYPEFSRESGAAAAGTTLHAELTNNLLWDLRYFIDVNPRNLSGSDSGAFIHYQLNWVGNVAFARADHRFGMIWMQPTGASSAYFADDHLSRWPLREDWDLNYCCNDYNGGLNPRPAWGRSTRHPFPAVTVLPSGSVQAYAVANAGAFPRDPMDQRLMGAVASGVIDLRPNNVNPAGDALRPAFQGAPPAPPLDTDGDGMPDDWERAHGLDPAVAAPNATGLSASLTGVSGYTDLECYLNELSARRVRENR